ncbi:MAG: hypothetical protein LBJ09_02775 [Clostridiales bacterium]|jgi:hypothetical protein|nr:hypothetical protein [Clostridiales bacterium]
MKKKNIIYFVFGFVFFLTIFNFSLVKATEFCDFKKKISFKQIEGVRNIFEKKDKRLITLNDANSIIENKTNLIQVNDQKDKIPSIVLTQNYDDYSKLFQNVCSNGVIFTSKIPNGFSTSETVIFNIPSSLEYLITKDDNPNAIKYSSGQSIKESGFYDLKLQNTNIKNTKLNMETEHFTFRIIKEKICDDIFNAPIGFKISKVVMTQKIENDDDESSNDEPSEKIMSISSRNFYRIKEDGQYKITVSSLKNDKLNLTTNFERVTKTPIVNIEGVKNGISKTGKEITYSADKGVNITVIKDNKEIKSNGILNEVGKYTLIAKDEAGNESEYSFEYKFKPNVNTYMLFAVLGLLSVVFIAFFLNLRKHIKIR